MQYIVYGYNNSRKLKMEDNGGIKLNPMINICDKSNVVFAYIYN